MVKSVAAVFLDRDGVLNRSSVRGGKPFAPRSLDDFHVYDEAVSALAALKRAGFFLVVATNQPDIGNGLVERQTVDSMHAHLKSTLPIDDIRMCAHAQNAGCDCRKPRPGMLLAAAREHAIDLSRSFMIGDRAGDMEAGIAAGCRTIFIDRDYAEAKPLRYDARVRSVEEAVAFIIETTQTNEASLKPNTESLKVKIFADGADFDSIMALYRDPLIKGFTTNPTLMRKAGVADYEAFARKVLDAIQDRPVSFEVFADDLPTMEAQARAIASWGENIYVKIPVTNTQGEFTGPIIRSLSEAGVAVNVTATFTLEQTRAVVDCLNRDIPAIVSIFAGRIADAGLDPMPIMREAVDILAAKPKAELLWASPREILNVIQADDVGCHIITVTPDVLNKLKLFGKDLDEFSLETVKMFYGDAVSAGYTIAT